MRYDIRAGTVDEIIQESGDWLFVDVGFSSKKKSCGVLKNSGYPCTMKFGSLLDFVVKEVQTPDQPPLNLLLEAPLSVTFDKHGNPARRSTDKEGDKYRDWWVNAAPAMIVATGHLLRRVKCSDIQREVRLFEGFASFKSSRSKSSHKEDVVRLRCAAWGDPKRNLVTCPDKLQIQNAEPTNSALAFADMDFGVPPVVKVCNHPAHGSDYAITICIDESPSDLP